jgi:uncharacterized protein YqiB (DUF1249 family)
MPIRQLVCAPNLGDLIRLYEENYRALLLLVPDPSGLPVDAVFQVRNQIPLRIQLTDKNKYTLTLALTYQFWNQENGLFEEPNLKIRLYQDAMLAEAFRYQGNRSLVVQKNGRMETRSPLEWKWEMNQFLRKWLVHCIHEGYRFQPSEGLVCLAK